jgi:hypothetical protein
VLRGTIRAENQQPRWYHVQQAGAKQAPPRKLDSDSLLAIGPLLQEWTDS